MIKILFLASNPEGTPSLKLDEEIRLIEQKIRAADYRDVIDLKQFWAIRPDDLLQALNEHKPQIVHFSGHGSVAGEIILMDRNRQVKPVSADAFRMLFAILKDNIRVVVLNACYSQVQAEAIAEVIDCVIGMSKAVGDDAAIIFAASFYQAIGFGRSIAEAFEQGKTAILLEGISEVDIPRLLTRQGVDPSAVFLIEKSPLSIKINELDNQQKMSLVKAILACSSMRDRDTRNMIADRLPVQIRSTIKRHPSDLVDVTNIVDRCLDFSAGLATLVDFIHFYEGNTQPMQQVSKLLLEFGFNPLKDLGYTREGE